MTFPCGGCPEWWDEAAEARHLAALARCLKGTGAPVVVQLLTPAAVAPHLVVAYVDGRSHHATQVSVFGGWFVCSLGLVSVVNAARAAHVLAEALAGPE
ncbi:hypothetical protein [Actinomadura kijaniata]|uniref:hypothetical protein n=1 Tax=Actinomadura kijaniata TaxID=46161 RepID=UPI000833933E|nr:hypothetical protein [Actinomadura kijaniata]